MLEDAGLIAQGRDAQRRPRRLVVGGPLADVDRWLGPFRAQWNRRFDALEALLDGPPGATPATTTRRHETDAKPTKRGTRR